MDASAFFGGKEQMKDTIIRAIHGERKSMGLSPTSVNEFCPVIDADSIIEAMEQNQEMPTQQELLGIFSTLRLDINKVLRFPLPQKAETLKEEWDANATEDIPGIEDFEEKMRYLALGEICAPTPHSNPVDLETRRASREGRMAAMRQSARAAVPRPDATT